MAEKVRAAARAGRPTARRSRSISATSISAGSTCWCRRASTPTAPTSSAPRSATSSPPRRGGHPLDRAPHPRGRPRDYSAAELEAAAAAARRCTSGWSACPHRPRRHARTRAATIGSLTVLGALQARPAGQGRAGRSDRIAAERRKGPQDGQGIRRGDPPRDRLHCAPATRRGHRRRHPAGARRRRADRAARDDHAAERRAGAASDRPDRAPAARRGPAEPRRAGRQGAAAVAGRCAGLGQPPRPVPELPLPEGAQFLDRSFSCAAGARGYRLYVPASAAWARRGSSSCCTAARRTPRTSPPGPA